MYQTMKIECLSQMIPFYDFSTVEKISVDAIKHDFVAMKVDYMKGVVLFGNFVSLCLSLAMPSLKCMFVCLLTRCFLFSEAFFVSLR